MGEGDWENGRLGEEERLNGEATSRGQRKAYIEQNILLCWLY
jgi:hypothetical protein